MSLHWRWYLITGLVALLLGALLQMPAVLVYQWTRPAEAPAYELSGVHGRFGEGGAAGLSLQGRPAFSELRWTLNPLGLLLASLCAQVEAKADQTLVKGQVTLWPTGRLGIGDLNYSGSVKALLNAANQPYTPLDGMARIEDASISLKQGWPVSAEGVLQIQNLAYTLARDPILLGDFQAELGEAEDAVQVKLSSVSGPLELEGTVLLNPDRSYTLEMKVRPKPEASAVLRNLLASNPSPPDGSGYYSIKQSGQAPAPP